MSTTTSSKKGVVKDQYGHNVRTKMTPIVAPKKNPPPVATPVVLEDKDARKKQIEAFMSAHPDKVAKTRHQAEKIEAVETDTTKEVNMSTKKTATKKAVVKKATKKVAPKVTPKKATTTKPTKEAVMKKDTNKKGNVKATKKAVKKPINFQATDTVRDRLSHSIKSKDVMSKLSGLKDQVILVNGDQVKVFNRHLVTDSHNLTLFFRDAKGAAGGKMAAAVKDFVAKIPKDVQALVPDLKKVVKNSFVEIHRNRVDVFKLGTVNLCVRYQKR